MKCKFKRQLHLLSSNENKKKKLFRAFQINLASKNLHKRWYKSWVECKMHIGHIKKRLTYSYFFFKEVPYRSISCFNQECTEILKFFTLHTNGKQWNQLHAVSNKNLSLFYCKLFFITDQFLFGIRTFSTFFFEEIILLVFYSVKKGEKFILKKCPSRNYAYLIDVIRLIDVLLLNSVSAVLI